MFLVTTDNDGLFSSLPAIDAATGQLTYTPAIDASGTANIAVRLMDDGGTANGGVDKSGPLSFAIKVLSPTEQIANLLSQIQKLVGDGILDRGQGNALTVKLRNVQDDLDVGQTHVALNVLEAFTNQVTDLVADGILPPAAGQSLLDAANALRTSLETSFEDAIDLAFADVSLLGNPLWFAG